MKIEASVVCEFVFKLAKLTKVNILPKMNFNIFAIFVAFALVAVASSILGAPQQSEQPDQNPTESSSNYTEQYHF